MHCAAHDGQRSKQSDSECKIRPFLVLQNAAIGKNKNHLYCLILVNFNSFPIIRKCVKLIRRHFLIPNLCCLKYGHFGTQTCKRRPLKTGLCCTPMSYGRCGPGSSVGIATGFEMEGPGIGKKDCGGGEIFRPCPDRPWGPPNPTSCTMGTGSFPGVKSGRGVTLTPHPLLVLWSKKSRAFF